MADHYQVLGIMSGTSLDGVDLACVDFGYRHGSWKFNIIAAETTPFSKKWKDRLANLTNASAYEYVQADVELGHWLAFLANKFIKKNKLKPMLIASHGHTIFHQPAIHLTTQIGNGAAIAALTSLPVVCDFRATDVAKNGQGAPLVPVGDRILFNHFTYCLNLGGIANISFEEKGKQVAFDICPVNMALNYLAGLAGKKFDKNGLMAKKGIVNKLLFSQLNNLAYYGKPYPKSLGVEWFNDYFRPVLNNANLSIEDKQATVVAHICFQLKKVLLKSGATEKDTLLVTGGGAFHRFLISQMKNVFPLKIEIPGETIINFKEALIFAFLGVLRWRNEINTLNSVTGAKSSTSSGAVYNP